MANEDTQFQFKIFTITEEIDKVDDWNRKLEDVLHSLNSLNTENLIGFISTLNGNKAAIAIKSKGNDIVVIYNSEDCFRLSTSSQQETKPGVTGLFSDANLALLVNLDKNLNISETSSIVMNTKEILDDIIQEADEKENPDPTETKYNINFDKIINLKTLKDNLDKTIDTVSSISEYLNFEENSNTSLEEYINEQIENKIGKIIEGYINHTHSNS